MRFFGMPGKRLNLLLALFFLVTNFASPAVFAQDGTVSEEISFLVAAYTCTADPGDVSVAANNIPADCAPTTGVWFNVATDVAPFSGGCTTDGIGQCAVTVADGAMVTVTEDTSTLVGVAPKLKTISTQTVAGSSSVTFINLPVAPISSAQDADPTEVPTPTDVPLPPPEVPTATEVAVLAEVPTPTEVPIPSTAVPTATEVAVLAEVPTATAIPTSPATESSILTAQSNTTTLLPATSDTTTVTPSPTPTISAASIPTATSTVAITPTPTAAPTQAPVTTTFGTVTNTGGMGLRCRTAPNTSATIITVLPEGTRLEARGAESNGWLPVRCGGMDGWVFTAYISISTSTATPSPTAPASGTAGSATVSNTGGLGLRCRTAPNTSATIITVLPEGSRVETRGAVTNGWLPVRCGGMDGWVSATYATVSTSPTNPAPAPAPTTPPVSGTPSTAIVTGTGGGGLNCRTAPVTGSVITILPEGARIEIVSSTQNGWAQVRCAGQVGWASAAYLVFNFGSGSSSGAVWIDVNLTKQYMTVYQGSNIIGQTYVSTGRYGFDTPPGTFYVNHKLPSQTMTGVLGGEYYYVEDVPWVMYFTNRGHAIHGAYWHNNFGYRMSHGCVNLPVGFSAWLYSITPVGTRVYIHY